MVESVKYGRLSGVVWAVVVVVMVVVGGFYAGVGAADRGGCDGVGSGMVGIVGGLDVRFCGARDGFGVRIGEPLWFG